VEEKLGAKFIQFRMQPFEKSYEETSASTPVFFILSPGVDPLKVDLIFYISKCRFDINCIFKYSVLQSNFEYSD